MKRGRCAPAEKARLHLAAIEQYIDELEKDKSALLEALKKAANGGLCELCANMPQPPQCYEADFDCAECGDTGCRCKGCTGECENFRWKGREK